MIVSVNACPSMCALRLAGNQFRVSPANCPKTAGRGSSTPRDSYPLSLDSLQSLSSDSATLAMQQAMLGADDSMDGTDDEDENDEEEEGEEEEEGMEEEEEEEDGENENNTGRPMPSGGAGRRDVSIEHREELE